MACHLAPVKLSVFLPLHSCSSSYQEYPAPSSLRKYDKRSSVQRETGFMNLGGKKGCQYCFGHLYKREMTGEVDKDLAEARQFDQGAWSAYTFLQVCCVDAVEHQVLSSFPHFHAKSCHRGGSLSLLSCLSLLLSCLFPLQCEIKVSSPKSRCSDFDLLIYFTVLEGGRKSSSGTPTRSYPVFE